MPCPSCSLLSLPKYTTCFACRHMGRLFIEPLEGRVYCCGCCGAHLASVDELVSKVCTDPRQHACRSFSSYVTPACHAAEVLCRKAKRVLRSCFWAIACLIPVLTVISKGGTAAWSAMPRPATPCFVSTISGQCLQVGLLPCRASTLVPERRTCLVQW